MNTIKKYLEAIRQFSFPRTRALRQELDAVREAHGGVSAELVKVREDLQHTREHDAQLLADLRLQIKDVESERSNARYQAELLERSLADAEKRQKSTEAQLASLERNLEEERNRHEVNLHATENSLANMQKEQQYLLSLQSDLSNTFQDAATRLLESLQVVNQNPRPSLPQLMLVAVVLFVTGSLVGVFTIGHMQDKGEEIAIVGRDIQDMRVFMKQHIEKQDVLLKKLTLALDKQTCAAQETAGTKPLEDVAQAKQTGKPPHLTYAPDIQKLQTNLIALGFDLGISKPNGKLNIKTRRALQEFRHFYMPHSNAHDDLIDEPLVDEILKSADLARANDGRFKIGTDVLAAIQLGSIRTGVDFTYLMELARVESNFNPTVRAKKSSATGLFQFTENSWLEAVRRYGAEYGLESYATRVKLIDYYQQKRKPGARDLLQQEVLALRLNPRLSTLLAAENIKHNTQNLSYETKREPGLTDLYLSHFFGLSGALMFLKTLDEEPTAIAGEIFPGAAARNQRVFQNPKRQPRTVAEVYRWFDSKFNTARYKEHNPG
ncbi:MAG: transglycosylase SLT domain-containing protein [Gammaproteobacteria bacterium]|nr:MAG: transglycosylase SLT domain-containing protein [Gammaproteobacteria bacterium]